ncbi:EAL domain-containing protein [Sulfuricystis multivorans]|uniref:EAL domain-containing protein n=1 Tax=Sulfuricystis multivorans TaxID=2211108 RepID=UPI000F8254BF|nr:EAL domain-containing protein [Sulfuricystis multivorans]
MNLLARLSIRFRLLIALVAVGLLLAIVGSVAVLRVAREIGGNVVAQTAQREARLLAATLVEPLILKDYTTVEQLMRREVTSAEANVVRFAGDGVEIEAQEAPAALQRPDWFAALLGLVPGQAEETIAVGGREYGRLAVTIAPGFVEDRLWRMLGLGLLIAAGAMLLLALAMHRIMRANLAGLEAIRASTQRRAAGDLASRIVLSPTAPPELVETAGVINRARDQLQQKIDELATEKERWRITLASVGDGVIVTDADGDVAFMNPVAERLSGWPLPEARGKPIETVMPLIHEETRAQQPNPARLALRTGETQAMANHTLLIARDGREIPVHDSAAIVPSVAHDTPGQPCGAVLVFRDDSERRALLRELRLMAFHDPLTGLPNRRALVGRIERALRQVREDGRSHVFCYIDLDQFKLVNDTCGHAAGDALLVEIVGLMQSAVPAPEGAEKSLLARIGGDEFGLLLFDCPLDEAVCTARRLVELITSHAFRYEARQFHIGASVGVAPLEAGMGVDEVLGHADTACYHAKDQGRGRVEVHSAAHPGIRALDEEMQWVMRFDETLAAHRFRLYRQRIAPLAAQDAGEHYEILLRVLDEQGVATPPGRVLAAVERFGYAPVLDRWVFDALLDHLVRHPADQARYAINLSGATLSQADLLEHVQLRLASSGIAPARLLFEITETAAIHHLAAAQRFIAAITKLGCRFCLDDFGAGLSSFAYLKRLPVSVLKIDGGFVRALHEEANDYVIVNAIAQIGRDLSLEVVAEWVENQEILDRLAEIGVDYVQGYFIHRPEPLPE